MKKRIQIFLILALAWLLACLVVLRASGERQAGAGTPESAPPVADDSAPEADGTGGISSDQTDATEETAEAEIIAWQAVAEAASPILESVPLDRQTQWKIYELCGQDNSLFSAVMAIANKESGFIPNIIGDNGRCIGMMQINYSAHKERIKRLGITDLLDPVQSATLAIDYIKDLRREFAVGEDYHVLYVSYNRGPTGARELFDQGIYSTSYSWDVSELYQKYLAELEAQE